MNALSVKCFNQRKYMTNFKILRPQTRNMKVPVITDTVVGKVFVLNDPWD
jgi:hypothetical protein